LKLLLLLLLSLLSINHLNARQKSPIREFLAGNKVSKGMGIENPSLVELMSLAYGTLNAIQRRIVTTKHDLANPTLNPVERKAWELRLRRAKVQYRLGWELMRILVQKSLREYDLRGIKEKFGEQIFQITENPSERTERDQIVKGYILQKAKELFLASLKFLALKHEPVIVPESLVRKVELAREQGQLTSDLLPSDVDATTYAWLDKPEFALQNPRAGIHFLNDNSIQLYTNLELIPLAKKIVEGFESLIEAREFMELKLDTPPSFEKRKELVAKVLGPRADTLGEHKTIAPLVLFYTHSLGVLIDPYNVNTHDSLDLMRVALTVLFRHVLDIDGNEDMSLSEAVNYEPFKGYRPLKTIVKDTERRLKAIYFSDIKTGPKLQNETRDLLEKEREYSAYHGNLLRDLFGQDVSHWIWTKREHPNDPRFSATVKIDGTQIPEGRKENGQPRDEMKELQDGDLWMEKGTGLGSDLIAWATAPATPAERIKSTIEKTSLWGIAKSQMVNLWAAKMGWLGKTFQLQEIPGWLLNDAPGVGIDYTGVSHTGIVETYGDPKYPKLSRTDFVDAFPNLMRQAWRRHGCGHSHSRLCMFLRVRKGWAREYVDHFERYKRGLEEEIQETRKKVKGPESLLRERVGTAQWILGEDSFFECRHFLTKTLLFSNETEMMQYRDYYRPGYMYCLKVLQYRGMRNFFTKIIEPKVAAADDTQLVRAMGKLVVEKARNIRNQRGEETGFGLAFDDRFDSFGKSTLYCSEHADLVYRLAWGREIYPESRFQPMLRLAQEHLSEAVLKKITGGFIKVPWGENDTVYAPKGVIEDPSGRKIWEVLGEMRRAFFGVSNE